MAMVDADERVRPEDEVLSLPARSVLSAFKAGSLSPAEYMAALIARIEDREPRVCALYDFRPDEAMKAARASEARWVKGTPIGPLDGMPVSIKDNLAMKGDPVTTGTAAADMTPVAEDAPLTARLREDGAIFYAKTTCPDFGMLSSGLSSLHRLARNPWDLTQNPGGSSAGAAAAGAAGYGPLHIGTDIGGSIRLPAGWTGLIGYKPSQGRVPVYPYYPGRCAGPMTPTVDDTLLLMASISRPDWRDATSLPPEDLNWNVPPASVRGMKIGLMLDAGCGLPVDGEIRTAVLAAVHRFEDAGAEIIPMEGILTRQMLDGLDDFWRARFWALMETYTPERRAKILPFILDWAAGAKDLPATRAAIGFDQMLAIRQATAQVFQGLDLIISPVNPVVSFPAEWAGPTNDPSLPFEHIAFTVPWNMGDNPACSINCGFSVSGMPIGLQIIGPRFADLRVLSVARVFESWTGGISSWPKP
ncbi:amidase [Pannonibacter sp. I15F10I1]|uniref:amidase n=1 Tax=Pannonibacter sp. I15F10I1 TaxID=2003580 RepID=UPI001FCB6524|nr:amidase [Pannonibacter sp. I15F10I1]